MMWCSSLVSVLVLISKLSFWWTSYYKLILYVSNCAKESMMPADRMAFHPGSTPTL